MLLLSLPYPTFATHTILVKSEVYSQIMSSGELTNPSLSLDGTFAHLGYPVQFTTLIFPLSKIKPMTKPVIYLLSKYWELVPKDSYYLQLWYYFYEAEIKFEGLLPVSWARCGTPPLRTPELTYDELKSDLVRWNVPICKTLPPSLFRTIVAREYRRAEKEGIYPVKVGTPPPLWLGRFIHQYNMCVCRLYGLDYSEILKEVKEEGGYIPWGV